MKAVRIHTFGGSDALRYEECEEPPLSHPANVRVKLFAAAVNRLDIDLRNGGAEQFSLPRILGCDGAGRIEVIGREVKHLKPGDAVCIYPFTSCAQCDFCVVEDYDLCTRKRILSERESGTYAEYITLPARSCFPVPLGFSFEQAAAFPLVYSTAWRLLMTQAKITPGETVLIRGIGGGIAIAALQIAASIGARLIVSSSSDEKLGKARALGVELTINDRTMDLAKTVRSLTGKRGVDVVVDCIGGVEWVKSLAALSRGGRLVTCGAMAGPNPVADLRRIFWNHLKICGASRATREDFRSLLKFFNLSWVKPIIETVCPLKEAAKAHELMESRRHFGKIVLRTDG